MSVPAGRVRRTLPARADAQGRWFRSDSRLCWEAGLLRGVLKSKAHFAFSEAPRRACWLFPSAECTALSLGRFSPAPAPAPRAEGLEALCGFERIPDLRSALQVKEGVPMDQAGARRRFAATVRFLLAERVLDGQDAPLMLGFLLDPPTPFAAKMADRLLRLSEVLPPDYAAPDQTERLRLLESLLLQVDGEFGSNVFSSSWARQNFGDLCGLQQLSGLCSRGSPCLLEAEIRPVLARRLLSVIVEELAGGSLSQRAALEHVKALRPSDFADGEAIAEMVSDVEDLLSAGVLPTAFLRDLKVRLAAQKVRVSLRHPYALIKAGGPAAIYANIFQNSGVDHAADSANLPAGFKAWEFWIWSVGADIG